MKQRSVMGCRLALYEPDETAPDNAIPVYHGDGEKLVMRALLLDKPTGSRSTARGPQCATFGSVMFDAVLRQLGRGWRAAGWRDDTASMVVERTR